MAPIADFLDYQFERLPAVNVCGVSWRDVAGGSIYALTNAAVAGITRGVARGLGPRGIPVN